MFETLNIFPAYGRRYKSFFDAQEDWFNGRDFSCSVIGGPYLSIREAEQLKQDGYTQIYVWNLGYIKL